MRGLRAESRLFECTIQKALPAPWRIEFVTILGPAGERLNSAPADLVQAFVGHAGFVGPNLLHLCIRHPRLLVMTADQKRTGDEEKNDPHSRHPSTSMDHRGGRTDQRQSACLR